MDDYLQSFSMWIIFSPCKQIRQFLRCTQTHPFAQQGDYRNTQRVVQGVGVFVQGVGAGVKVFVSQ